MSEFDLIYFPKPAPGGRPARDVRCSHVVAELWRTSMTCARRRDGLESAAKYLHTAVLASCEQRGIAPDVQAVAGLAAVHPVDPVTVQVLLSSPDWISELTGPSRRNFWYWSWAAYQLIAALCAPQADPV